MSVQKTAIERIIGNKSKREFLLIRVHCSVCACAFTVQSFESRENKLWIYRHCASNLVTLAASAIQLIYRYLSQSEYARAYSRHTTQHVDIELRIFIGTRNRTTQRYIFPVKRMRCMTTKHSDNNNPYK